MVIIMYIEELENPKINSRLTFPKVIVDIWKHDGYIAPKAETRYLALILNSMKRFVRKSIMKYMAFLTNGWSNRPKTTQYSKNGENAS